MNTNVTHFPEHSTLEQSYIALRYDQDYGGIQWGIKRPNAPKRYTLPLLKEIRKRQQDVINAVHNGDKPISYQILTSAIPNIYSLGGDLEFFLEASARGDRDALLDYARLATEVVYNSASNYNLPVTTINVIKGISFGGGFESAMAANVIIAEKQSLFSFPETRFGMIPGMGALTLLKRRIPMHQVEKLIFSGETYSSEDLFQMGVIDVVCEEGEGDSAAIAYIRKNHRNAVGRHKMRAIVNKTDPISLAEMYAVTEEWVDCALQLSKKNIKIIETILSHSDLMLSREK